VGAAWHATQGQVMDEPNLQENAEQQQRDAYANAMAELVAHIAHEVNQPLAAIAANANACMRWLGAAPSNIDEARSAAERIVRDARRASDVIGEMRASLSRTLAPAEPVSLDDLAGDTVEAADGAAARAQVTLHLERPGDSPIFMGRRGALRQALAHLVTNALEACLEVPPSERHVTVRVCPVGAGAVELRMEVDDTGRGFGVDAPRRLFEPLFSTKPGRLGLGLAVARSIVEEHGGRLLAQRTPDGVTRFILTLPRAADAT
jgi:signal transduction histidine kinase